MSDVDSGNPLIRRFRSEYQNALKAIETNVSEMIKVGKEMRAIITLGEHLAKIAEIHKQLGIYYAAINSNQHVLRKFGSVRLQQWNQQLAPTMKLIEGSSMDEEEKEKYVLGEMRRKGYTHRHWFIKERVLVEIDYMLDVLGILIEPDFMPIVNTTDSEGEDDRRIRREDRRLAQGFRKMREVLEPRKT